MKKKHREQLADDLYAKARASVSREGGASLVEVTIPLLDEGYRIAAQELEKRSVATIDGDEVVIAIDLAPPWIARERQ